MHNVLVKSVAVVAAAAAMCLVGATTANAGPAEVPAFTHYAAVVASDTLANLADTSAAAGDNITCDPVPVVDGHMVNPRVGVVVGEVYGMAEMTAHWKCVSLDTGAMYDIAGTVTDWYYAGGGYAEGDGCVDSMPALAGSGTVNPVCLVTYAGGHPGLNTWHYARFVGTTSTGRNIAWVSPLFFVAGI